MNTQNNNKNNEWSKREIGALWKKDGPSQKYLSGYLTIDELGTQTKVNVVVFSNKNKSKDTAPDFRVYLSKDVQKSEAKEPSIASKTNVESKLEAPKKVSKKTVEVEADEELL